MSLLATIFILRVYTFNLNSSILQVLEKYLY